VKFKEMGCEGVDWFHLSQKKVQCKALVNTHLLWQGKLHFNMRLHRFKTVDDVCGNSSEMIVERMGQW